ncbi:MAG: CHAT domain-containing protein [Cyanothece sp. SIO2G6]|nr:CHAT domain-containing protein [Cyanothece sp. SIO2G6]
MLNHSRQRWSLYALLTVVSLGLCLLIQPGLTMQARSPHLSPTPTATTIVQAPEPPVDQVNTLLQQAQQAYETDQWDEAIATLTTAITTAAQTGDNEAQLIGYRNLALVYRQLRDWEQASGAIAQAFSLIEAVPTLQQSRLGASVLDVQGSLYADRGQVAIALEQWQQAAQIYTAIGATDELLQNQINQSQVMQAGGFYRQAIELLAPLEHPESTLPDSPQRAISLQSLGDALRSFGILDRSQSVLETSLAIAQRLQQPYLIQSVQLSLANTQYTQGDNDRALATYQELTQNSLFDDLKIYALSNQLNLLATRRQPGELTTLWNQFQTQIDQIPPSRSLLLAYVNVAQRFIQLDTEAKPPHGELGQFLAIALQQAQSLGDRQSESYALGTLASLYEKEQRLTEAKTLTQEALQLAQAASAPEISYQWQWQLGRIYKIESDRTNRPQALEQAISFYINAVDTLKQLRTNLVAVNAQVQVTFQDSVEPIHRQLVSLLLDETYGAVSAPKIDQARTIIESLQLAELDNFFQEACLDTQPVNIEQLDASAAIFYPIMLADRLEVVVRLPNQPLRHYSTPVSQAEVENLVRRLRPALTFSLATRFRSGVTQLYDWMIRPIGDELKSSGVNTLVFVLDGALRNIPMAALYNGDTQAYLIQDFSIAITPSLQLVQPRSIQTENLQVLTGALSEAREDFGPLPNVEYEIAQIQAKIPAQVLFNDSFTASSFQTAMANNAKPIVHLATHGQFSSNKDETFLLTWDGRLDIDSLNRILQGTALDQQIVELLIMSACQTATGDKQAALGLAGMAIRAGARSTVATLWRVSDEATALLMEKLYEVLSTQQVSRAEALRQAQLAILNDPNFDGHPYFWAPFILVGSWL